ncbi:hypothetical protein OF387_11000 [Lentilactobacillus hilgardii]|nr:hypothetical protein [Lentilactobacillus hilgardii]MCV3741763.1 hypothetical protein [Lentilactobacillus hilgardii]
MKIKSNLNQNQFSQEEKERLHLAKAVYNSKSPILTNPKDIEKYLSEGDNKNHPQ